MFQRFQTLTADKPDAAALIDGESGAITTRAMLLARAEELASRLAHLREEDVFAVQLPNGVDFVAAFLAAVKLQLVFASIDRDARDNEVAAIVEHFSIRALLNLPVEDRRPRLSIATPDRRGACRPPEARMLKLTSGSSGKPRAIVWSEANIIAVCESICSSMNITPHDINLGAIPFSHSYGFSNLVTPLVLQGTPIVFSNDYLPHSLITLANRYECTIAPLIPMVFEHLTTLPKADGRFDTVCTFISAGAPLSPSTSRRFRARFGIDIHSFYGCTEAGGIAYDREGGAVERGIVGSALDGVSVELVRRTHRLAVRSGSVALGTLVDAKTFEPFDGGFVTDDFAEIDANGEIALTGRRGDLINTAGKKVNPREVEQVILQIDGVRQAKVYGEPAGARGEVVAAAVVADPDVTREIVREFCRAHLSLHKVPRIVKLIERIPIDERGKVKRAALISAQ